MSANREFLDYVELVKKLRDAQRNYFRTRHEEEPEVKKKWKDESIRLERLVDKETAKILAPDSQGHLKF